MDFSCLKYPEIPLLFHMLQFCLHPFHLWCLNWVTWAMTCQHQQNECAPSEDSDQPGHLHLPSLIRVFAGHMKKHWVLSYPLSAQQRLWSDWADTQTDLSLRWAHSHIVCFVLSWLKCSLTWRVWFPADQDIVASAWWNIAWVKLKSNFWR